MRRKLNCSMPEECRIVVAANTGTSSDAVVSSVVRVLECLGDEAENACVLLLTTEGSLSAARRAKQRIEEVTSLDVKVLVDSDYGFNTYGGLFLDPRLAVETLRELGECLGERLRVVDITGGTKLQSFLALNLLQHRGGGGRVAAYVPGQGFAARGPLRGWWSGLGYPRTPRSLQPVLTAVGSLGGCCDPRVLRPPRLYDAVGEASLGLSGLVGFATWLLNAATCSRVSLVVEANGLRAVVARIDWSGLVLEDLLGAVVHDRPPWVSDGHGDVAAFDSWMSLVCKARDENAWRSDKGGAKDAYRCLGTAAKMATSELVVKEAYIGGEDRPELAGKPLADILFREIVDESRGPQLLGRLLPDTNAVYYGLINTLYLFATRALIDGKKNIAENWLRSRGALLVAHSCVLGELRRHGVESIKHSALPPCRARGLLALYAADAVKNASREVIPGSGQHCDLDLVETAEERKLVLVTGDTGMLTYAKMRNIDYVRVADYRGRAVGRGGEELWRRHLAAAAAAQLLAVLALTAEPMHPLHIEGDNGVLRAGSVILDQRLVLEVEQMRTSGETKDGA